MTASEPYGTVRPDPRLVQLVDLRQRLPGGELVHDRQCLKDSERLKEGICSNYKVFVFQLLVLKGFIDRLSHQPWDILMLGMEWSTGADEAAVGAKEVAHFAESLRFQERKEHAKLCIGSVSQIVLFNVPPGGRPRPLGSDNAEGA